MRECRIPPVASRPNLATMADAAFRNAAEYPAAVAFRGAGDGVEISAAEFAAQVTAVGKGLIASGVRPGDRVALLAATRYEWTVLDYAIWSAGAVTVPVYDTSSAEQIGWILRDSGAAWCVVGNAGQAATVAAAADRPIPVWRLDEDALGHLAARAAEVTDELFSQRRAVEPDSLATIIYTSGTTGRAKGVLVTHRNFMANLDGFLDRLGTVFAPGAAVVLFLSLAHIFTRTMQCAAVRRRVCITHVPDAADLAARLRDARPTVLPLVPRFMEKLRDVADGDAAAVLGGRCTAIVVGGAPHDKGLGDFYRDAGVAVYEGYGLTEVAGPATINGPGLVSLGTVGLPLAGVSVRIANDGEVLVSGDCVFAGYHRNPSATAAALADGWLRTGDIGELDGNGYLRITGRKKDLIITAGGKNVDATTLESRLRAHPLISNAMLVGDGRPFVACLVTLDPAALDERGVTGNGYDQDPTLRAEVASAVAEANRAVSRAESIRAFRILDREFTVADGDLTASLKIRRDVVHARHGPDIEALYGTHQ